MTSNRFKQEENDEFKKKFNFPFEKSLYCLALLQ